MSSTSLISLRCDFLYFKNSKIRPSVKLRSGSSGKIGRNGILKKECIVLPPALIAATPVGANTICFLFVWSHIYRKKVDFPVPAFPVRNTDCEVY